MSAVPFIQALIFGALVGLLVLFVVILDGKSVVMALLLDLVRAPLSLSWMFLGCALAVVSVPFLSLPVRCLLEHFLSNTVLLGLLVGSLLGVCHYLGTLLIWFMQMLELRVMMGLRWVMREFTGLVVLLLVGKEFD